MTAETRAVMAIWARRMRAVTTDDPAGFTRKGETMKLTEAIKAQIDGMSYVDLLRRWRYALPGDVIFQGESGKHYAARLKALKDSDPGAAVAASKRIGWDSA